MPAPIYRRAPRKVGIVVLLMVAGIAGQFGIIVLSRVRQWDDVLGIWLLPLSFLPVVLPVVGGIMIFRRAELARIERVRQRLIGRGFDLQSGEELAPKEAFSVPLKPLFPYLGSHGLLGTHHHPPAAGIKWFAVKSGPVSTFLFEHTFRTGYGKSAQYILQTILVWPADHPDIRDRDLGKGRWCVLSRFPNILAKVVAEGGGSDAAFAALSAKGRIAHDPATAKRFLTRGVTAELQKAPMRETWYVGAGWVLCVFSAPLDGDHIDSFLDHAREVVAATKA